MGGQCEGNPSTGLRIVTTRKKKNIKKNTRRAKAALGIAALRWMNRKV